MKEKVKIGKTTATPILLVNEAKPLRVRIIWASACLIIGVILFPVLGLSHYNQAAGYYTIADVIAVIVLTAAGFFWLPGRTKFYICEEGIGFPRREENKFYEWNTFSDFTADDNNNQFNLKRTRGSLKLTTKQFDRVKDLLSQYIRAQ